MAPSFDTKRILLSLDEVHEGGQRSRVSAALTPCRDPHLPLTVGLGWLIGWVENHLYSSGKVL